jgi:tyrosyl-tRNA synthetase
METTINTDSQKIEEVLTRGVAAVYNKEELREKLLSGKQLHLKLGTDVTGSFLTLGHSVLHRKLRDFQELGHKVTLIIGDFTTLVGDHSDKVDMRSEIDAEQIKENEKNWKEQFFKTVIEDQTTFRHNSEWLKDLNFNDVIHLAQQFTIGQMLDREAFRKRFDAEKPIGLDEFLYPLMQGYDSVALNCDVELGGTDQTFNVLAGRKLMPVFKQKPQSCLLMRLLTGNDGRPMGKSLKNYIAVMEEPSPMYGKLMTIVDEIIPEYFELVTRVPMEEVRQMQEEMKNGANPMQFKKRLAREVVTFYHGESAAIEAEAEFERVVQNKELPQDITTRRFKPGTNIVTLLNSLFSMSRSDAKRLIEQKAVRFNEKVIEHFEEDLKGDGILKAGKKNIINLESDETLVNDVELIGDAHKEETKKSELFLTGQRGIVVGDEIFEMFPSFQRGVIIVKEIQNSETNERLRKLLADQIENMKGKGFIVHPNVVAWHKAHEMFGSNPNRFPPSIESLLKRTEKDGFPFVNSVVALFNYISLKYLIPCGGDDIDKIAGNLTLGLAKGDEVFTGLGSKEEEHPNKGEVIYFDDRAKQVMCRKWNWRNSSFTAITTASKQIVINLDGIDPVNQDIILEAQNELNLLLQQECNAVTETNLLNKENNYLVLNN